LTAGGTTQVPDTASESEQLARLAGVRRLATGLLVLMVVVFFLARSFEREYAFLAFVAAFSEAAMVGALADWFAVTALFRYPLGIPIPHTAIIPRNKDRIGASVANFLEHNFMTREVLREEMQPMDFAGAASRWLSVPENRRGVSLQITRGIPAFFRLVEDEDIGRFLQSGAVRALSGIKAAPVMAEIIEILVKDGRHQAVFDRLVVVAYRALERNEDFLREKVQEKTPSWLPRMLDDKLFERLLLELQNLLREMAEPENEWRERFQLAIEEFIEQLRTSPEYSEKIDAYIAQALHHPLCRQYIEQVWSDVKTRLIRDAESPDSQIVQRLDAAGRMFGDTLASDEVVREKLNAWMREFAADAISRRRKDIANLVEGVIRKWDAETVSRKFELYVGKDLQYIRINGTLVGGCVGLILHTASLWL